MSAAKHRTIKKHQRIVEAAGGIYVPGLCFGYLVLFNSPQSGSTLAIHRKEITISAVRNKIAASDKKFGF